MDQGDRTATDFARIRALRSREAGYSVARKTLELQGEPGPGRVALRPDAVSWYLGTLGEIAVGERLAQLGDGWLVLHSVPFGSAETDIDHLVIGPTGIYSLNTKHHRGAYIWVHDHALRVENQPTHYLQASLGEVGRVLERLRRKTGQNHAITPVLVMVNPRTINDKRAPDARLPAVVDARDLVGWLRQQPPTLSRTEIELVTLAAEEPDTWHVDPSTSDTLRVMQRFDRLRASVGDLEARPASRGRRPASGQGQRPRAEQRRPQQARSSSARQQRPPAPSGPSRKVSAALSELSRGILKIVALVLALPVALVLLNAYLAALGK
ncbi:hypothetical protein BH09ACT5_BH09ACT5_03110 [soil metagenome]